MITQTYFVALASVVFGIGILGCLRRRGHVALVMISGAIATLSAIVLMVAARAYAGDVSLPLWAFALFFAAAAQACVASSLMICVYQRHGALALRRINAPRG